MSVESINKINQWIVDFSQAKVGLKNIEILVHSLTQDQLAVTSKLQGVFKAYEHVLDQGDAKVSIDQKHIEAIKSQLDKFHVIERRLHSDVVKFVGKSEAQLDQARGRVQVMYQSLSKLRTLKEPQYSLAVEHLLKQTPEFLTVFDAFMSRFTMQLRWQQAVFYKTLAEAFNHIGLPDSVDKIKSDWWSEFQQIAQAVEALKSVHLRDGRKPIGQGHTASASMTGTDVSTVDSQELPIPEAATTHTEKTDNVITHSVKWINAKVGKDVKNFRFSDPRIGFFGKPTVPPTHESEKVTAVFDFDGEAESDLPFKKGAVITVIDKGTQDDPNWWCGEYEGRRGLFPKNYVEASSGDKHPDEYIPRTTINTNEEDTVTKSTTNGSANLSADYGVSKDSDKSGKLDSTSSSKAVNTPETVVNESIISGQKSADLSANKVKDKSTDSIRQQTAITPAENTNVPAEEEPTAGKEHARDNSVETPEKVDVEFGEFSEAPTGNPELPARDNVSFDQIHSKTSKAPAKSATNETKDKKFSDNTSESQLEALSLNSHTQTATTSDDVLTDSPSNDDEIL